MGYRQLDWSLKPLEPPISCKDLSNSDFHSVFELSGARTRLIASPGLWPAFFIAEKESAPEVKQLKHSVTYPRPKFILNLIQGQRPLKFLTSAAIGDLPDDREDGLVLAQLEFCRDEWKFWLLNRVFEFIIEVKLLVPIDLKLEE